MYWKAIGKTHRAGAAETVLLCGRKYDGTVANARHRSYSAM
jgi:hypothetical protein